MTILYIVKCCTSNVNLGNNYTKRNNFTRYFNSQKTRDSDFTIGRISKNERGFRNVAVKKFSKRC